MRKKICARNKSGGRRTKYNQKNFNRSIGSTKKWKWKDLIMKRNIKGLYTEKWKDLIMIIRAKTIILATQKSRKNQ